MEYFTVLTDFTNLQSLFTWLVSETTTWSLTAVISWYIWIWSLHSLSSLSLALKGKWYIDHKQTSKRQKAIDQYKKQKEQQKEKQTLFSTAQLSDFLIKL